MSIERMKRMWVVTERTKLRELLAFLASLRKAHLTDVGEHAATEETGNGFSRPDVDRRETERRITRLHHILDIMNTCVPPKRGIAQNFVSLPLEVTAAEMTEALEKLDVDELNDHLTRLYNEHLALGHRMEEIHLELGHLRTWTDQEITAPSTYRHCTGHLGTVTGRMRRLMDESDRVPEVLVVNELGVDKQNRVLLQAVALKEDEEEANDLLRTFEFQPLPLAVGVSLHDMIRALEVELTGYEERTDAIDATIAELIEKHRDRVTALLGHWETKRDVVTSQERTLSSKRMMMASAYVRARDVDDIEALVTTQFPEAAMTFNEPALEENVPVELRTSRLFASGQFLTSMYGLPHYRAFDPSPFLMFSFLVFFGCCFGDAVYGPLLFFFSLWVAGKLKDYPGTRHFFTLFAWGGVFATLVGLLTGSWAGDLPLKLKDLYGISFLNDVRESLMIIDPIQRPAQVLLVVLGIGAANQFYGIILGMYRDWRLRDWPGVFFDGGLWLITLPGFIMLVTALFSPPVPAWVSRVGLYVFLFGAVGLVLTQGRKEKGIVARVIVGFVSVYGIMGTYGATGFIGDTLSYSRLLALGLVTAIVANSFNLIAEMVSSVAGVGIGLFLVIVIFGHVFNFVISILGAFVHSGRLIFLEFFGRFYESGGIRFSPLGTSDRVRVID